MSYIPTHPDATAVATDMAARLTTSGVVGVFLRDSIVALADNLLCSTGFLGPSFMSDSFATGSVSYSTNAYNDVSVLNSWTTPAIPIAKTYLVWCQTRCFVTAAGGVNFRITVDGSAPSGQPASAQRMFISATNLRMPFIFAVPVALTAATHVIRLQWSVDVGATAGMNADDGRTFWISGG